MQKLLPVWEQFLSSVLCPLVTDHNSLDSTIPVGEENKMLPVLLQTQYISAPDNSSVGTLLDLASTDDYVTHSYAKKKGLSGKDIDLIIEGMGGKESSYRTKLYLVPIKIGAEILKIPCYGMDKITSVAGPPDSKSYR